MPSSETSPETSPAQTEVVYSKKNPFPSALKQRVLLNGRGSHKRTFHLEFSLESSGLNYIAGDALALIPKNCPDVVSQLIEAAGLNPDETVPLPDKSTAQLIDACLSSYDITGLNKSILKKYNQFAQSDTIEQLLNPENKEQLQDYLYGREVIDMLVDYPVKGLKAADFVGILRKLLPRLYSIASSPKAHQDEVHLTIAVVNYHSHGRDRKGVASTFIDNRLAIGDTAPVFVHQNKNFKLPENSDVPIIMVGPGTGIAPFRSFIEDRAATDASSKNWLFFGDRNYSYDFLYQTELQGYLKSGVLDRLDVAFSRDTKTKYYVQHRMLEQSKALFAWLQEGAHFYVCGDANRMAGDVHEALIQIAENEGNFSREEAEAYIAQLKKDKRYQRDVY